MSASYKELFSRRALKYKEPGFKDKQLTDIDCRNNILEITLF
jgi:hypothetical protein